MLTNIQLLDCLLAILDQGDIEKNNKSQKKTFKRWCIFVKGY